TARAIAVEVLEWDSMLEQVFAGWRSLLDTAGWGDVISRHAVAENAQSAGAGDGFDRARLQTEAGEEGRLLDISAFGVPFIGIPCGGRNFVPLWILRGKVAVQLTEHLRAQGRLKK